MRNKLRNYDLVKFMARYEHLPIYKKALEMGATCYWKGMEAGVWQNVWENLSKIEPQQDGFFLSSLKW